jgi:hypothetical protein
MAEKILIAAHAIHPLIDDEGRPDNGDKPGAEFAAHLIAAANVYRDNPPEEIAIALGGFALTTQIYVPGSRHRVGGTHDRLSLSQAGAEHLINELSMPAQAIHGKDWSRRYIGLRGVYHSGNEAAAASAAFHQEPVGFQRLIAVCSPDQVNRLGIHYRAHDVEPEFVTATAGQDSHGGLIETLLTVYTKHVNQSWERGLLPALIRHTRMPRDGRGIESIES